MRESQAQVFFNEFCKIFKNIFFLQNTSSGCFWGVDVIFIILRFTRHNIESTKHIHIQIALSETAFQIFLNNCGKISENWQNEFIKCVCLLPIKSLLNVRQRLRLSLLKTSAYSELFWSVFPCIRTEYGEILHISLYSVRMQEITDQNNSKYGQFLRSFFPYNISKHIPIYFSTSACCILL